MPKKRTKLCDVFLSDVRFAVYTETGVGCSGLFRIAGDASGETYIELGIDSKSWPNTVGTMLHEIVEAQMYLDGAAYGKVGKFTTTHTQCRWFMFDHVLFTEMMEVVADAVIIVMPLLKKAHAARQREMRAKK